MKFTTLAERAAARARDAAQLTMAFARDGLLSDEPDITSSLVTNLQRNFSNARFAGLRWSAKVVPHHSGRSAHEKRIGADILIHVTLDTPNYKYSKGAMVQAKRFREDATNLSADELGELTSQCRRMLSYSPAAFVFYYGKDTISCASATLVAGTTERNLARVCHWSAHRFFLELFRCPIGDPRMTSATAADLQIPLAIEIQGVGAQPLE
jgi:hypothetical protein